MQVNLNVEINPDILLKQPANNDAVMPDTNSLTIIADVSVDIKNFQGCAK